jgi:hypothetical protein
MPNLAGLQLIRGYCRVGDPANSKGASLDQLRRELGHAQEREKGRLGCLQGELGCSPSQL